MTENKVPSNSKLTWLEPTVTQLDVRETAVNPMTGGDAPGYGTHFVYPDCTRS